MMMMKILKEADILCLRTAKPKRGARESVCNTDIKGPVSRGRTCNYRDSSQDKLYCVTYSNFTEPSWNFCIWVEKHNKDMTAKTFLG